MTLDKTTISLSNRAYDVAKIVTLLILPALATLYFALATVWNLPYAEQVVGTIAAITTFLGSVLHVSATSYNNSDRPYDGSIDVMENEDGIKVFSLSLNSQPEQLEAKQQVLFKVNS